MKDRGRGYAGRVVLRHYSIGQLVHVAVAVVAMTLGGSLAVLTGYVLLSVVGPYAVTHAAAWALVLIVLALLVLAMSLLLVGWRLLQKAARPQAGSR